MFKPLEVLVISSQEHPNRYMGIRSRIFLIIFGLLSLSISITYVVAERDLVSTLKLQIVNELFKVPIDETNRLACFSNSLTICNFNVLTRSLSATIYVIEMLNESRPKIIKKIRDLIPIYLIWCSWELITNTSNSLNIPAHGA